MKNRYDIKTNPPQPSSEQIEQHRDFDALLQAFEQAKEAAPEPQSDAGAWSVERPQRPASGRLRYLAYAVTSAAAIALVFWAFRQTRSTVLPVPVPPTAQLAEQLTLKAPLPPLDQRFERLTVADAAKGEVLHYPSGSEIVVPAAAFVDAKGYPVEGAIEIEYREFADAVDMFLAGVPQQLGKHQNLQSTGMMEIKGFQNGTPIYLNMDKKLEVSLRGRMAVDTDPKELGVYTYSTQRDAWEYQGADRIERLQETPTVSTDPAEISPEARQAAEATLAEERPQAPIKPGIGDDMQVFDFDINLEEFPELAAYADNVEFIGPRSALTPATFDTVWNAMELTNKGNSTYELQLIYETPEESIIRRIEVYPAVASTPEARAQYTEQKAQYEKDLATWNASVEALALSQETDTLAPVALVDIVNYFSINRFGLWNCGKPVEWAQSAVEAAFVNEAGAPLELAQVFVTTSDQQLYYSAPSDASNTARLQYTTTEAAPTIWAMSADGGLWVANTPNTPEEQSQPISLKGVAVPASERDFRTLITF